MAGNIFSHPQFPGTTTVQVIGYNLFKAQGPINTNSGASTVASTGAATITPASMTNIAIGTRLIADSGANAELVTVTAVTGTTFTATFAKTHSAGFILTSDSPYQLPNFFGPWVPVAGYSSYTNNLDIVDVNGTYWDLYRVQPIVQAKDGFGVTQTITLPMSRPFKADDVLYDNQISALLDNFRRNHIQDLEIKQLESTNPSEGSGASIEPFLTDSSTSRFFLAFLPNAAPVKFIADTVKLYQGTSRAVAQPMVPWQDYALDEEGGYIDFASIPTTSNYLRCEYQQVRYTNDVCRGKLLNAVSSLGLYGINGFEVSKSNNLYYLSTPLSNRDLGEIVCMIAAKQLIQATVLSSFEAAEQWEDGKIKYVADPSRSIQAATLYVVDSEETIRHRANSYIVNSRTSGHAVGEFSQFFDTSGILPVYSLIVSNYNAFGWWL